MYEKWHYKGDMRMELNRAQWISRTLLRVTIKYNYNGQQLRLILFKCNLNYSCAIYG